MIRRGSRTGKSWPLNGATLDYVEWDEPRPDWMPSRVRPPPLVVAIALGVTL